MKNHRIIAAAAGGVLAASVAIIALAAPPVKDKDPVDTGGESANVVKLGNMVYAGTMTSKCFAAQFLSKAAKDALVSIEPGGEPRMHQVNLGTDDIFSYPMVIMNGQDGFALLDSEREKLRQYCERGGFVLASAGCSSAEWDRSFRAEMAKVFPDVPLKAIGMDHPVFHTVYDIAELKAKHGVPRPLEGLSIGGRLAILYSSDGLNDTAHTNGCCCCGGNEITNAINVNVNVLAYALTH